MGANTYNGSIITRPIIYILLPQFHWAENENNKSWKRSRGFFFTANADRGSCPKIDASRLECPEFIINTCLTDIECGSTKMCCSNGCNLECSDPVIDEGAITDENSFPNLLKGAQGDEGEPGEKVCKSASPTFWRHINVLCRQENNVICKDVC